MERFDQIIAFGLLGVARAVDATSGVATTVNLANIAASQLAFMGLCRRPAAQAARRVSRSLEYVSPWIPDARCVHRAAAGRVWLAACGVRSQIVIGVRRDDGWMGHAWLEVEDEGDKLVIFAEEVEFRAVWRPGD